MKMRRDSTGFTIMELMIAIALLSVILLASAEVFVNIGGLLTKGANLANVQDDARNIVSDVSSSIEFGTNQLETASYTYYSPEQLTVYAYCIGNVRYSYVIGFPATPPPHVLWKDLMQNDSVCFPLNLGENNPDCGGLPLATCSPSQTNSGLELTGPNMALANFTIQQEGTSQLYDISLGLVYGHADLFIQKNGKPELVDGDNYQCSEAAGQQFCATSYLTTFATPRLAQN